MKTDQKLNMTMLCDFYELTMGNGYLKAGFQDRITYFDVYFRSVPDGGGYAIAAGLDQLYDIGIHADSRHRHNDKELTKPFYDKVKDKDDVTKMQYIDINFWLIGDILLKADKMSMAHCLESRVPFLDEEVFNVARTLPTKYKVNKSNTKYAMRKAANQYLPDMVAEKKKLGFPVPIRIWLKDEKYYNMIKKAFTSEAANKYFNTDELVKYLDEHKEGKADNSRKIWTVYMFLVWYNDFFGDSEYAA